MIKQIVHTGILCFIVLTTSYSLTAQVDGGLLLGLINATTSEMNAVSSPVQGSLLYNTTEKNVYQYNGSSWEEVGSSPANENWTISGNNQYSSVSGNVGIGTKSPNYKLSIATTGNGAVWQQFSNVDTGTTGNDGLYLGIGANEDTYLWNAENTALRFYTNNAEKMRISNIGNVGIGEIDPSAKLDVNGKARFRNIPVGTDSDELLTTDANGNIRKIDRPLVNKSYVQVFKGNRSFGSGNARLLNLFPEVTIQAGKKVKIDLYVPTRDNTNSWGGLYVNINAKVNGTWYNLGNTGYDGGVMHYSAQSIHALNHEMLLDLITNLNLPKDQPYTLQFELTARAYNGTTYVNQSHDINRTANNLSNRGALQTWASDQNYCHIIIEEKDL